MSFLFVSIMPLQNSRYAVISCCDNKKTLQLPNDRSKVFKYQKYQYYYLLALRQNIGLQLLMIIIRVSRIIMLFIMSDIFPFASLVFFDIVIIPHIEANVKPFLYFYHKFLVFFIAFCSFVKFSENFAFAFLAASKNCKQKRPKRSFLLNYFIHFCCGFFLTRFAYLQNSRRH